jgi:hypothetical protein
MEEMAVPEPMFELTPEESSALVQATQYRTLPKAVLEGILQHASKRARAIGGVILGWEATDDQQINKVAEKYQNWYDNNLQVGASRGLKNRTRNRR